MSITKTKKAGSFEIPTLGLGAWGIGGFHSPNPSLEKEGIQIVHNALDLGYQHIDTAEYYATGFSEEIIGKAISGFDRKKVFITTKVQPIHLHYAEVVNACKNSLKRLNTDYVDLYLVHAPNPDVPIEETMKAMNFLVSEGLARFIGVSNFSVNELREAQACSENKIVANQIEYNLMIRNKGKHTINMESEILPFCQEKEIIFMSWRPLGKGELIKQNSTLLNELVEKYGKTSSQIAINWLILKKNVVTMPKATSVKHLQENIETLNFELRETDVKRLNEEFEPRDEFYEFTESILDKAKSWPSSNLKKTAEQ
ncbi:MAG: aldo/keto reductase [Candidatus Micrarchaeota archaeon]